LFVVGGLSRGVTTARAALRHRAATVIMKRVNAWRTRYTGGAMPPTSDSTHDGNGCVEPNEAQLQARLVEVAAKMRIIFARLSEIETNYPEFWEFVQGVLRDHLDPSKRLPAGVDLETWAKERGAQPLETFLQELEQIV
jgi:hypothetical protein